MKKSILDQLTDMAAKQLQEDIDNQIIKAIMGRVDKERKEKALKDLENGGELSEETIEYLAEKI